MSSNEEDYNDAEATSNSQAAKKRRIQRACDICRRKKVRCDGVQMPENRCSNCVVYNLECTYVEAAKKRGPPKGYVERLETRLEKLEGLLRKLCPDDNLLRKLDTSLENGVLPADPSVFTSTQRPTPPISTDPKDIATSIIRNLDAEDLDDAEEDNAHFILADNLKNLSLEPVDYRFFGKSSGAMLIQTAIELKNEYTGGEHDFKHGASVLGSKREEFWSQHPWEGKTSVPARANYNFPEPDLMNDLITLYFDKANLFLPLLHRPSFVRSVAESLHQKHDGFGVTVLLVCAIGSRFSEDSRVLLDGEESYHSAGWKWFEQVQIVRKSLLAPPILYDLQYYCLSVQYLQGSSAPQSCWTMVGIGIRLAQDVGAHRKKAIRSTPNAEDELWKRAFWCLVYLDRLVSAALGRPCAIQDEDFDLEMPIECDDEYWDTECNDPEQQWKQPPGRPSRLVAFNLHLKLNQILAFSLRTIYSINKSKILLGFVGSQWAQHIVAELDSTLNKWVDSVPDHLRWDPTREDQVFLDQSVVLYCAYYHIQILIHRPFIPSPNNPSPLSFPSLAICTNAARSCTHVVDVQQKRNRHHPPQVQMAVFTSGIVLLLSIWGGKRSGLSTDPNKEMVDVHKCMRMLRSFERQWHSAGRLWDILYELASVGDLPLPQPTPPSNKRERDSETPISSPSNSSETGFAQPNSSRPIAGSRRIQKEYTALPETRKNQKDTDAIETRSVQLDSKIGGRHTIKTSTLPHALGFIVSTPNKSLVTPRQSQMNQLTEPEFRVRLRTQVSSDDLRLNNSLNRSSIDSTSEQTHQQYPPPEHHFFSLPVYSQDLGKLPLHGQLEFSSMEQPHYWYNSLQATEPGVDVGGATMQGIRDATSGAEGLSASPAVQPSISAQPSSDDLNNYANSASGIARMPGYSGDTANAVSGGGPMEVVSYPAGKPSGSFVGSSAVAGSGLGNPIYSDATSFGPQRQSSQAHVDQYGIPRSTSSSSNPTSQFQPNQHQRQEASHNSDMRFPGGAQHQPGYVDSDTMAMWSSAPTGFELDEWGTYLMNVSEMTHGHGHSPNLFDQVQVQPHDGGAETLSYPSHHQA